MKWARIGCLLFAVLAFQPLKGQNLASFSMLTSYTQPNSSNFNYIRGFSVGGDAALLWKQLWQAQFDNSILSKLRRPYNLGVRGNFTWFPNDIAGQRISLSGVLQNPVVLGARNQLFWEADLGLACYTDPYSRTPNPDNVFIGSYLNCMVEVGMLWNHRMGEGYLSLAGKFVHSSNGYLKKPNKGLNYLQLELGYTFDRTEKDKPVREIIDSSGANSFRHEFYASYAPGIVQPRYTGASANYFYAYTAQVGWTRHLNVRQSVGASVDVMYNYSHDALIAHHKDPYSLPFYVGVCANYEMYWNRLSLRLGVASYVLSSTQVSTQIYERVGVFYHLGARKRHFVGVALKSHAAHIDYIEWHYGFKLFRLPR